MKIRINHNTELALGHVKGTLLMVETELFMVNDFVIEYVDGKIYLTSADIRVYHKSGKFLGVFNEKGVIDFIEKVDIFKAKKNWEDFKEILNAFGFDICKSKKDEEEKFELFKHLYANDILNGKTDLDIMHEFKKKYSIPENEFLKIIDIVKKS